MSNAVRRILRFGGLVIIALALLANLPGPWLLLAGIVGIVMFFAAGPT